MKTNDPDFDRFWAAYPRKIGKLAAFRVWQRIKPDETLVTRILESIQAHEGSKNWRDGFIPHPTTYLTQGRWLDELGYSDFYHARL